MGDFSKLFAVKIVGKDRKQIKKRPRMGPSKNKKVVVQNIALKRRGVTYLLR